MAQLIVNNGILNSAPDTVTITTENTPPVANAGPDDTTAVGATVQLDGSASSDVDGDALTFAWSLISRPAGSTAVLNAPTAVRPTFVADQPGTYVAQLIVNDGQVNSPPDTVTITTENLAPVANAGPDDTATVGATAQLDGSASSDPDGDPLTYNWAFVSRPNGSTATLSNASAVRPTFVVDRPGTYVVQLIVNDGKVNSPPDTVTITTVNSRPTANAGIDSTVAVGATVQLDGSGSSDPDGDDLTYQWSLTSRPQGSNVVVSDPMAVRPTFVADVAGTYVAQLIVNDGQLDSAPDSVVIMTSSETTLGCGLLLTGTISAAAEVDQFTFSGQANQRVTLTLTSALSSGWPASAILFSPSLAEVIRFNANSQQQLTLPETGTYVIQMRANNLLATGNYTIGMECLQPLNPVDATLSCGTLLSGQTIESAAEVDQISFSGQANQRVTLTLTSALSSGWPASAILFSPSLEELMRFNANSQQQLTVPESGTYVIQMRASNLVSAGSYNLGLQCPQ